MRYMLRRSERALLGVKCGRGKRTAKRSNKENADD
jgi:hypothetical protein